MASLDTNAFARGMASVPQIDIAAGERRQTANLMNMMKVQALGQEMQDKQALRNAMASVDYNNITGADLNRVGAVDPSAVPKLAEMQEAQRKTVVRNLATALMPVMYSASDDNLMHAAEALSAMGMPPDQIRTTFAPIMSASPEARPRLIALQVARDPATLEAMKLGLPKPQERTNGRQSWIEDTNPLSPGFGSRVSVEEISADPNALLRAASDKARLKFEQDKLEFERGQPRKPAQIEKSGEDLFVAKVLPDGSTALEPARVIVDDGMAPPPSEVAPGAGAVPATPPATPTTLTLPELKARNAARKVLDVFEYNPETGTSRLEELIAQTSSGLPQTGETAILSLAGKSTPQSKALTEIESMMRGMVATVTDNKLGAQVSNADRDFLMEQYGKFNDTKKPIEDRLAAADAAFRRLNKSAGYPARAAAPAPARPAPAADTGAVRRPGGKTPTPQHIEMLRADPTLRNYFDTTYGAGAAAKILGE